MVLMAQVPFLFIRVSADRAVVSKLTEKLPLVCSSQEYTFLYRKILNVPTHVLTLFGVKRTLECVGS